MDAFAMRLPTLLGVGLLAALLAGCAGLTTLQARVTSQSQWPSERRPASYVFERLPSQQADPERQDMLEAAARPALSAAGLREVSDAAQAELSVQLSERMGQRDYLPWSDPYWRWGLGYGGRYRRYSYGALIGPYGFPYYEHEVAVLLHDRAGGQSLYESRALAESDGRRNPAILSALFDAALKDFPLLAVSPRTVKVPLSQ